LNEEKGINFLAYGHLEVAHSRACGGTVRANFFGRGMFGFGQVRHGRARFLDILGSIFFHFLESCSDNYVQNNLKQQKTNKIKAIKPVGCLP